MNISYFLRFICTFIFPVCKWKKRRKMRSCVLSHGLDKVQNPGCTIPLHLAVTAALAFPEISGTALAVIKEQTVRRHCFIQRLLALTLKKIINRARIFHRETGSVSNSRVRPLNESHSGLQGEAPLRLAAEESLR